MDELEEPIKQPSDTPTLINGRDGKPSERQEERPSEKHSQEDIVHKDVSAKVGRLYISEWEERLLGRFSPLVGRSPRRVLRLVNTYRIIKACLPEAAQPYFIGEDGRALGARALTCLLAIAIGAPRSAHERAKHLVASRDGVTNLGDLRRTIAEGQQVLLTNDQYDLNAALATLDAMNTEDSVPTGPALVRELSKYAPVALRYGFVHYR